MALDAISEMIKQKGFLDVFRTEGEIAKKGVLVRHMILPDFVENSINALTSLFVEFGKELPLSLMSQYHPVQEDVNHIPSRFLSEKEFNIVYEHAQELGFKHLFVQFPEKNPGHQPETSPFLPDFREAKPFR